MTQDTFSDYRLFGRRQGAPLSPRQQRFVDELLPQVRLQIPVEPGQGLQLTDTFSDKFSQFHLEIGFGGAEHLIWQAQRAPETGFIGCEPFLNGVVKLLAAIDGLNLENIKVHDQDARDLLDMLPPSSLAKVYILFPDPWPKQRHRKRRIITQKFLDQLSRVMMPGAHLCFASDISDYIAWVENHIAVHKAFEIVEVEPIKRPQTRYEQKAAREGRLSVYLSIVCTK